MNEKQARISMFTRKKLDLFRISSIPERCIIISNFVGLVLNILDKTRT